MPAERLSMRKITEILQLRWGEKLSQRDVARSVRVSPSTVFDCVSRAQLAGLRWPLPDTLDEAALEALLYPVSSTVAQQPRALPDWSYIHSELRRKGVTLQLLWDEYKQQHRATTGISTVSSASCSDGTRVSWTWCCGKTTVPERKRL